VNARKQRHVLFLFNHDAAHQAAHIAGIAGQLAVSCPSVHVIAAVGTPEIRAVIEALLPIQARQKIEWISLDLPAWIHATLAPLNKIVPARRIARLRAHHAIFASVDMIVSTERTCLRVRRALGDRSPAFCYVPHGSGDRNVAYHPELAQFDLFLLSGQKLIDEMVRHKLAEAHQCRLIGYPKFDSIKREDRPRFFDNDLPVFLYNPHFDPHLSSWYKMGNNVLDYFMNNSDRYNLIFAPHVMLFRKKLHISPEFRIARFRPEIDPIYKSAQNILIDTSSSRLFDMSYTLAADAYIGDMSSQVYEFLVRRRPCFFLDTHSSSAGDSPPPYEFWRNGDVCRSVEDLKAFIPHWRERGEHYASEQDRLFEYTIDDDKNTASTLRAALAIDAWLKARTSPPE
jgi:hypothetical protein